MSVAHSGPCCLLSCMNYPNCKSSPRICSSLRNQTEAQNSYIRLRPGCRAKFKHHASNSIRRFSCGFDTRSSTQEIGVRESNSVRKGGRDSNTTDSDQYGALDFCYAEKLPAARSGGPYSCLGSARSWAPEEKLSSLKTVVEGSTLEILDVGLNPEAKDLAGAAGAPLWKQGLESCFIANSNSLMRVLVMESEASAQEDEKTEDLFVTLGRSVHSIRRKLRLVSQTWHVRPVPGRDGLYYFELVATKKVRASGEDAGPYFLVCEPEDRRSFSGGSVFFVVTQGSFFHSKHFGQYRPKRRYGRDCLGGDARKPRRVLWGAKSVLWKHRRRK